MSFVPLSSIYFYLSLSSLLLLLSQISIAFYVLGLNSSIILFFSHNDLVYLLNERRFKKLRIIISRRYLTSILGVHHFNPSMFKTSYYIIGIYLAIPIGTKWCLLVTKMILPLVKSYKMMSFGDWYWHANIDPIRANLQSDS